MLKLLGLFASLALALCACDAGPYDPSAHRRADASTGSMLSGTDTGVDQNGSLMDPSVGSNKGLGSVGSGH